MDYSELKKQEPCELSDEELRYQLENSTMFVAHQKDEVDAWACLYQHYKNAGRFEDAERVSRRHESASQFLTLWMGENAAYQDETVRRENHAADAEFDALFERYGFEANNLLKMAEARARKRDAETFADTPEHPLPPATIVVIETDDGHEHSVVQYPDNTRA